MKTETLDKLFSQFKRLSSGGYCGKCGKFVGYSNLQNAHFFGRWRHVVRWDKRNTIPLCLDCHQEIDLNAVAKAELALSLMNRDEYDELARLADKTIKDFPIDKKALAKEFREGIKRLQNL
uniref:Uncharacterized protein n=1 Tax=viral metagenome TaxID=1070528 RepID=A0A6M3LDN6_9ZZZZ